MDMFLSQVVWLGKPITESTWEPGESLPVSLVAEYEAGVTQDIQRDALTIGGQTVHTLSSTHIENAVTESIPKRCKIDLTDNVSNTAG